MGSYLLIIAVTPPETNMTSRKIQDRKRIFLQKVVICMFKKMLVFREVTTSPTSGMDLSEIWRLRTTNCHLHNQLLIFSVPFQVNIFKNPGFFPSIQCLIIFEDLKKNHPCDTTNRFKLTHNLPKWVGSQLRHASFTLFPPQASKNTFYNPRHPKSSSHSWWGSVWKEPSKPKLRRCLGVQTPILTRYLDV